MNYKFVMVNSLTGQDSREWIHSLPATVGRCPSADIHIDDPSISRRHCQFMLDPYGALTLRDSGSTNGVFVDNLRVKKVTVRPGSEVRIGAVVIRVELTEEVESPSTSQNEDYDLAETERMKIVRPVDDVYEIG